MCGSEVAGSRWARSKSVSSAWESESYAGQTILANAQTVQEDYYGRHSSYLCGATGVRGDCEVSESRALMREDQREAKLPGESNQYRHTAFSLASTNHTVNGRMEATRKRQTLSEAFKCWTK